MMTVMSFLSGTLCYFGLEFKEWERLEYHQSPEVADLTQCLHQNYCSKKMQFPPHCKHLELLPSPGIIHLTPWLPAWVMMATDWISVSSSRNNAPQNCFMELFTDKSNNELNNTVSFSVFCNILISATVSGSHTMSPCMCQRDGWYLQCLHLGADCVSSRWTFPRGCSILCHWIRKANCPLPRNVLFSPNTKYFNGNNDTH